MPRLHSVIAGLGALSALAAPMLHPHPSGSTDRVTPGAVRVESSSHVRITLLDDRGVIKQMARDYDVDLAKGSGFTVTPDGVVVTATQIVQATDDPRVYAANRVFAEYFKVKIPADFKRHSLGDADLDRRLQSCYPPQQTDSTCIADVTTNVSVFPYLDPPPPGGLPAQILTSGASPASPAVLKVTKGGEKQSLPTVPLGTTIGGAVESLDVMSLPGRPSAKTPPKLDTAHLDPPGSRTVKERDKVLKLLDDGAPGAALIDDGRSEVVGFVSGGGGEPETITPADDIRSALVAAGVTPAAARSTSCTRTRSPPTTTSSTPARYRRCSRCSTCGPTTRSRPITCGSPSPRRARRRTPAWDRRRARPRSSSRSRRCRRTRGRPAASWSSRCWSWASCCCAAGARGDPLTAARRTRGSTGTISPRRGTRR
ncbi:hypothetical protein GCM10027612_35850 [Microbispora bryophytorum subsp. camponoti]